MGIQEPQQPVQQQQPAPVAEQRLLNALIRPEKTENRLDEFDLFKKSAPMKTPASKPGASSAEMRKFFQSQANKDKPGLKPKSVDMDNPQKVYTRHAQEDTDAISRMARDLTGPGAPDAKRRAQRDQQRQKDRAQSDGRDHGPKWGVAEGPQDDPEDYRAHLLKTLPRMMNFLSKNVKGWKPTEEQYLAAIETGYQVMKHTGDVQQAGKAMSDELNTLHRMSQNKSGMMEAYGPYGKKSAADLERIKKYKEREAKRTVPGQLRKPGTANKSNYDNDSALSYFSKINQGVAEGEQDPQSELKMINQKLKDAYKRVRNNSSVSIGWYMSEVKALNARREELIKQLRQGVAEGSVDAASATPAKNERGRFTAWDDDEPMRLKCEDGEFRTIQEINMLRQKIGMKPFSIKSQQGMMEAPKSAAVRLGNAIKRVQGTTAASQARSVIPSSIPKPEPKPQEKQVTKELKTGPAAHFTPKDAHVKRGQFVGGESKKKGADGKACWDGYRYNGTKNGKDSCVKVSEDIENIMSTLINKIVVNEAIQNNNR